MELKRFVKSVLKDVIDAVEESREESSRDMYLESSQEKRTIEFDIAVTVEDATASSGGAGIKVFQIIEGGADVSRELKNSSVSRIRFGVYINRLSKQEEARLNEGARLISSQRNNNYM